MLNDNEIIRATIEKQIATGLRLNPNAALQAAIAQAGLVVVHNEFALNDGTGRVVQAGENLRTGGRSVFIWAPGQPVRQIPGRIKDDEPKPDPDPDPAPLPRERTRVGLHAAADPGDMPAEDFHTFAQLRPEVVKVLSAHSEASVARLAMDHPDAIWIIRAFLHVGDRGVTPEQFYDWTASDTERTIKALTTEGIPAGNIYIELHNEPNLSTEGFGSSWATAPHFAWWLAQVLSAYRRRFPTVKFMYPGLSPGPDLPRPANTTTYAWDGVSRQSMWTFLRSSADILGQFDALGSHVYWGAEEDTTPATAVAILRALSNEYPLMPIFVTEVSHNGAWGNLDHIASQYAEFLWRCATVRKVYGAAFFVASGSTFAGESWQGKGIAERLRARIG